MKTNKKLKRKRKIEGRKICHGDGMNCLHKHGISAKKTPKGTKPKKKEKKVYKKHNKIKYETLRN